VRLLSRNDICISRYLRTLHSPTDWIRTEHKCTWSVWKARSQCLIKHHTIKAFVSTILSESELPVCSARRITHGKNSRYQLSELTQWHFIFCDTTLRRKSRTPFPSSRAYPWRICTLRGCSLHKSVWYEHINMLQRLHGLLILSTDKSKYFSLFHPSVILYASVSFALYWKQILSVCCPVH
jgi:hypothetical protein